MVPRKSAGTRPPAKRTRVSKTIMEEPQVPSNGVTPGTNGAVMAPALNGTAAAEDANAPAVSQQQVRERAYELFIERGCSHGDDLADWFRAEMELSVQMVDRH